MTHFVDCRPKKPSGVRTFTSATAASGPHLNSRPHIVVRHATVIMDLPTHIPCVRTRLGPTAVALWICGLAAACSREPKTDLTVGEFVDCVVCKDGRDECRGSPACQKVFALARKCRGSCGGRGAAGECRLLCEFVREVKRKEAERAARFPEAQPAVRLGERRDGRAYGSKPRSGARHVTTGSFNSSDLDYRSARSHPDFDNHANQLNPNNDVYWRSRGDDERPYDWESAYDQDDRSPSHDDLDNHANQMNPNNEAYWESRGYDGRPEDWEAAYDRDDSPSQADLDNHADQMNPNNDAYWESRGYDGRPDD